MNKKSQKWKAVVQLIIFLAGVLMVLLPVILETVSWQKDLEEYQAMADQYKVSEPDPEPEQTAVIPAASPTLQPTAVPTRCQSDTTAHSKTDPGANIRTGKQINSNTRHISGNNGCSNFCSSA